MFPKIIHLTCNNKHKILRPLYTRVYTKYQDLYPDYNIKLHDNNDIYKIIKLHFPEHLQIVKDITNSGILSDLFRYLILYLEGGIYSDMDCEPLKHVDYLYKKPFITEDIDVIICKECSERSHKPDSYIAGQLCQWFIIAKPQQKLFRKLYLNCIDNIINNISDVRRCTGPILFTNLVRESAYCNIYILPLEYFAANILAGWPFTENSIVKHHFSGSWRGNNRMR